MKHRTIIGPGNRITRVIGRGDGFIKFADQCPCGTIAPPAAIYSIKGRIHVASKSSMDKEGSSAECLRLESVKIYDKNKFILSTVAIVVRQEQFIIGASTPIAIACIDQIRGINHLIGKVQ